MKRALAIVLLLAGCGRDWKQVCVKEEMTTQLVIGPSELTPGGLSIGSGLTVANKVECVQWKRVCARKDGLCPSS